MTYLILSQTAKVNNIYRVNGSSIIAKIGVFITFSTGRKLYINLFCDVLYHLLIYFNLINNARTKHNLLGQLIHVPTLSDNF